MIIFHCSKDLIELKKVEIRGVAVTEFIEVVLVVVSIVVRQTREVQWGQWQYLLSAYAIEDVLGLNEDVGPAAG